MKTTNYNYGFSLLEVIISIFILGIIATTVVPAIGSSVVNIITAGKQDQALNTAANFTEIIQQEVISKKEELTEEEWEDLEEETIYFRDDSIGVEYSNCAVVENNPGETKLRFCKENTSGGYKLKVVFFYDNGEKDVKLNSFVSYKRR